jgi:hypothetical protein
MRGMLMAREVYDVMNNTGAVIENFVQNSAESGGNMSASARIAQFFQNGTTVMKKSSTVWNPGTHATNWIGNMLQGSVYGGVDPVNWTGHVAAAAKEVLNEEGPAYEAFRRFGGSQAGNTAGDISVVTDPLRVASQREIENLRDRVNSGATPQEIFRAFMAVSQDRIERADNRLTDIYQLSDSIMKVALMRAHMKRGLSAEESFLNAEEVFFDYGLVPPIVRWVRSMPFGSPFISWTYMATALTIKKSTEFTVLRRNEDGSELRVPNILFLLPWLGAYSVIQGLALAGDEMEDEDLKFLRPGLPPFLKEGFGTLYAGLDESGRAQLIDAAKYLPFGDRKSVV